MTLHDPNSEFDDGMSPHWLGGHTAGLQVVRVKTRRGYVVLASDASHYYANILQGRPFPVLYDMDQMLKGIRKLADSPSHIIPGHDRQVLSLFPAARDGVDGIARLDADPRASLVWATCGSRVVDPALGIMSGFLIVTVAGSAPPLALVMAFELGGVEYPSE